MVTPVILFKITHKILIVHYERPFEFVHVVLQGVVVREVLHNHVGLERGWELRQTAWELRRLKLRL